MPVENDAELFDWTVRNAVYAAILERSVPPSVDETAAALSVSSNDVRSAYERLNDRHALFLTPGSHDVRMAHPFSGVPTAFRVEAGDHTYWANCAWDTLGIPAALHADVHIQAPIGDGESIRFAIEAGRVQGWQGVVHFPLPFRRWYDDLIET
jgi:DNA-binding transcriptional MocR family regulator